MQGRIEKLWQGLIKKRLEALLVTNFYNIRYLTGFVGLTPQEREAYALVTSNQVFLFTDGRYIEQTKRLIPVSQSYSDPGSEIRILEIKPGEKIVKLLNGFMVKLKIKNLGIEKNDLRVGEFEELKKSLTKYHDRWNLSKVQLVPTENLVEDLRAEKEPEELAKIEKAAEIADKCFAHILRFLKPGLTEKEVADEIEWFIRKQGAADLSFDPLVASGPNSSLPHCTKTENRKLETEDIVLLDFGAKVDGYCSDMTRVVFLGRSTEEQKKIYLLVSKAQRKALGALLYSFKGLKSSADKKVKAQEIDKVARSHLKSCGFEFIHGLGHGVGLSEHEAPRLGPTSRDILKEGMVFSLEPGVYLPGRFGIRIEDLVVLEKSGPKILTKSTKEIIEL